MELKNFEIEYKRRFLIKSIPKDINLVELPNREINLSYLNTLNDTLEIECESINDTHVLNIRDIGYLKRNKIKIPLDQEAASVITQLSNPKKLIIKQYELSIDNEIILLNFYNILNKIVIIAEYNNSDEKKVRSFKAPKWFDIEITTMNNYSNISMAINKKI